MRKPSDISFTPYRSSGRKRPSTSTGRSSAPINSGSTARKCRRPGCRRVPPPRERHGQVHRHRGFADASLATAHRDHVLHARQQRLIRARS